MDLLKINLFSKGFFKQLKFLISSPLSSQDCIYISEPGNVSMEVLPMNTGYVESKDKRKSWKVIHSLKYQLWKDGVPTGKNVLVITDRSYLPFDPLNNLKAKDKEKLLALTDIASMEHAKARSDSEKQLDPNTRLSQFIINACFILLGLFGVIALLKGCG